MNIIYQVVGEAWLNSSYYQEHDEYPSQDYIVLLWACVIASKEVGKILGTILLPFVAESWGRRFGLQVLFIYMVFIDLGIFCFLRYTVSDV